MVEFAECLLDVVGRTHDDPTARGYRERARRVSGIVMHKASDIGNECSGSDMAAAVIREKALSTISQGSST